jgi:Fanconi anemia group J protein
VHKVVSRKGANRNEECNALLADPDLSCEFYHKAGKLSKHVSATPSLKVHDIEDLVKAGKKQRGCPYYAARLGVETAELIFCPYSYIMDPTVRRAMAIDIDDAVVIFDEVRSSTRTPSTQPERETFARL